MKITLIQKEQIPAGNYEGYLWLSNASEPIILNDDLLDVTEIKDLPFVVEGLLYSKDRGISIRIVNIDGIYRISLIEGLDRMDEDGIGKVNIQEYFIDPKRFKGNKKLKIYQHYEAAPDPLNYDWPVLQPAWFAFIGFDS